MNEWDPEHVVDAALARRLLARARPQLADAPLEPLGEGFDNTCFLVGEELVLRFPRRAVAVELLETERRLLAQIGPRVPLAVPEPVVEGAPGEGFPWPWLGVKHVPGETGCVADPSEASRERAAEDLAAFLRALWPLEVDAPPDAWKRADVALRRLRCEMNLDKLHGLGLAPPPADFKAMYDAAVVAWEPTLVTCHGDLYARHLVFDEGRLSGVIDWGDCHRGDRVKDLAVAWLFFPAGARARFRAALGDVRDDEWRAARALALFHATFELLYGLDRGDEGMVEIGARAIAWIHEELAA